MTSQFRGAYVPGDHTWALPSRISGSQNPVKQLAGQSFATMPRKFAGKFSSLADTLRNRKQALRAGPAMANPTEVPEGPNLAIATTVSSAGAITHERERPFIEFLQIVRCCFPVPAITRGPDFPAGAVAATNWRRPDKVPAASTSYRSSRPVGFAKGPRRAANSASAAAKQLHRWQIGYLPFYPFSKASVRKGGLTKVFRLATKVGGKLYRLERLCRLSCAAGSAATLRAAGEIGLLTSQVRTSQTMTKLLHFGAAAAVCLVLAASSGCTAFLEPREPYPITPPEPSPYSAVPRELDMVSLPPYVIEPPDILMINAVKVVPKPPHHLEPFDGILMRVVDASGLQTDRRRICY